jgi:hypothetical protein
MTLSGCCRRPILRIIASEIRARPEQVKVASGLLGEGATVPFVARYRKEATGGLDDTQLRQLEERLALFVRTRGKACEGSATLPKIARNKSPSLHYAARLRLRPRKGRGRVIFFCFRVFVDARHLLRRQARGWDGECLRIDGMGSTFGALRPVVQVTRRGIRPSTRRRISWAGHDVGR